MLDSLAHIMVMAVFAGLLIAGAIEDALHYRISNRLTVAIALLYPVHVLLSPTPVAWMAALALAAGVLLVGFGLFVVGWIGGGDAKMFAAVTLWSGVAYFQVFLLATTMFGAAIALIMLGRRYWMRRSALAGGADAKPTGHRLGQPDLPYGVAIAFGGLATALILTGV